MHKFGKLVLTMGMGMLSLLSVMPLAAQVANSGAYSIVFTAPFPFYAGNVKLPAGSYIITQPNQSTWTVLIRNIAGTKGEFINFVPTTSLDPQKESDVTFRKFGDTGYLQTLSVEGDKNGIEFPPTKAEAEAETMARNTNGNATVVEQVMFVSGK
jgi:hypothetical protein